jgi:hypothetical protein
MDSRSRACAFTSSLRKGPKAHLDREEFLCEGEALSE